MKRNYYITGSASRKMIRFAKKLFRKSVAKGELTDSKNVYIGFWKEWWHHCISYDDLSSSNNPKFLGRVILRVGTVKRIQKP
jgi:hypothetical protein